MSRKKITQKSFSSGIISPLADFRSDSDQYKQGIKQGSNVVLDTRGAARKRPGFRRAAKVKTSSNNSRFIKFRYSNTVSHTIEVGNQYMRFYNASGQILNSTTHTVTNITESSAGVTEITTSSSHGLSVGQQIYLSGVVSNYNAINSTNEPYVITYSSGSTLRFALDLPADFTYTSGGTVSIPYEISSPYTIAQVDDISYVQSGSDIYLFHSAVAPYTLTRESDASWTLEASVISPVPTYEPGYTPNTTLTPGATSGTGVSFTAGASTFLGADVGRQLMNLSGAGVAVITSVSSATVAVADIIEAFPSTSAITATNWKMDLSPICDLTFDGIQKGSIVRVRSTYVEGTLGTPITISGVTQANPAVVTTATHGLVDGNKVVVQDIVGMTQINDRIFTIDVASTTTFSLLGENSSAYTAYGSGGRVRQVFTDIKLDAFRSTDVDSYIIANGGVLKITEYISATEVKAVILKTLNTADATSGWSLESPTWSASRGYPSTGTTFESRLWVGGTTAQPKTIWSSAIGDFLDFGVGPDEEDALDITIVSDGPIQWLSASRDLIIGCTDAEYSLNSPTDTTITSTSIKQLARTFYGSDQQQPLTAGYELIYLQAANTKIRTFGYDYTRDGYLSEELTYLINTLTADGIVELAYLKTPTPTIYAVTNDGQLLCGIYDKEKKIIGWTNFETDGYFERVSVVESSDGDILYTQVRRIINGSTVRSIERLNLGFGFDSDMDGFSDCYAVYSSSLTVSSISLGSTTTFTVTAHGLTDGDTIVIKGITDELEADQDSSKSLLSTLNGTVYTVDSTGTDTFTIKDEDGNLVSTATYNSYTSAGYVYKRVTTLTNLRHLEGKVVNILADGAVQPSETVVDGTITIDEPAGEVVIGLPYTMTLETLDAEYDIGVGSMQDQKANWVDPRLKLYQSSLPTLNSNILPSRDSSDLMNVKPGLYTGYAAYGSQNFKVGTSVTITSSEPLPVNILGITGFVDATID